jgi:oxygen-independent coproporphyrinogen III oxidase
LPLPDPDLAAEMYEWLDETLEANGYMQYEISNWAKERVESSEQGTYQYPSFACKHNVQYWRSWPYLAFGAGAHGYAGGYRYSNVLRIKTYIDRLSDIDSRISQAEFPWSPVVVNLHKQSPQDDLSDYMINNLRLVKAGVSEEDFRSLFGSGLMDVYPAELQKLTDVGLLEWFGDAIRLTRRGRLLGNQVFLRFV